MSYHHVPRIHFREIERFSFSKVIAFRRKDISNFVNHAATSRQWFRDLLWAAFPARSECDLAKQAAPVLGVSARQVRNWLREENDASLRHVTAVLAVAGAELTFTNIKGGAR